MLQQIQKINKIYVNNKIYFFSQGILLFHGPKSYIINVIDLIKVIDLGISNKNSCSISLENANNSTGDNVIKSILRKVSIYCKTNNGGIKLRASRDRQNVYNEKKK